MHFCFANESYITSKALNFCFSAVVDWQVNKRSFDVWRQISVCVSNAMCSYYNYFILWFEQVDQRVFWPCLHLWSDHTRLADLYTRCKRGSQTHDFKSMVSYTFPWHRLIWLMGIGEQWLCSHSRMIQFSVLFGVLNRIHLCTTRFETKKWQLYSITKDYLKYG